MSSSNQPTGVINTTVAAWTNFSSNIRAYAAFAALSVALGSAVWLVDLAVRRLMPPGTAAQAATTALSVPFALAFMVLTLSMIRFTWKALGKKEANVRESVREGLGLLKSFVWLSLLTGLAFVAAPLAALFAGSSAAIAAAPIVVQHFWLYVLAVALLASAAGAVLLILAYYALPISFSADYLTIDGQKGWSCLKRSFRLVRGRWWRTLWRLAVPSLFFWMLAQFVLKLAFLLMGLIFGDSSAFFEVSALGDQINPVHQALLVIVSQIVYSLTYPLFLGANLIVWNDLKKGAE